MIKLSGQSIIINNSGKFYPGISTGTRYIGDPLGSCAMCRSNETTIRVWGTIQHNSPNGIIAWETFVHLCNSCWKVLML